MLTHHDNIELVCGDDWVIVGKLLGEDGEPLDLTANVQLGWTLLGPDGNQLVGLADVATLEVQAGGIVVITVPDSFTKTLRPARYMDAIRVTLGDASVTQWSGIISADADPFHPVLVDVLEAG